jgi:hypothetical protein
LDYSLSFAKKKNEYNRISSVSVVAYELWLARTQVEKKRKKTEEMSSFTEDNLIVCAHAGRE